MKNMAKRTEFFISTHPLVLHKLAHMRKTPEKCPSREFARLMREIGMLLGYEATENLPLQEKPVRTERSGDVMVTGLFTHKPVIVPILRTGLVMAEGLKEVIPTTYTGHIGLHNDHTATGLEEYMVTLPGSIEDRTFIIVDPVIATGLTACRAIEILIEFDISPSNIRYVTVVVTKEAKALIMRTYELGVQVYAACDTDALSGGRAMPGLGSVSSRLFRTN